MFLAVCVDDDLGSYMSVAMPWTGGGRRVVVEGEGTVEILRQLLLVKQLRTRKKNQTTHLR